MENIFLIGRTDIVKQDLPRLGHAAPDDKHFRIDHRGHRRQALAQVFAELLCNLDSHPVLRLYRVPHCLGGQFAAAAQYAGFLILRQTPPGQTHHPRGGGILLQAAVILAAAGIRLIVLNMNMPDFTARAGGAGEDAAVHNDASSHAGTQSHGHYVGMALAAALPHLAESCHIGIIGCFHRQIQLRLQYLGDIEHIPSQVYRLIHSALCVHWTRRAYTHTQNLVLGQPSGCHPVLDGGGNVRQDMGTLILLHRGNLPFLQHLPLPIEQPQLHCSASDVYSDCVFFHFTCALPDLYIRVLLYFMHGCRQSSSSLLLAREFCTRVYNSWAAL